MKRHAALIQVQGRKIRRTYYQNMRRILGSREHILEAGETFSKVKIPFSKFEKLSQT